MIAVVYGWESAKILFLLWVFFLAVMHARDARNDGTLETLHWSVKYAAKLVLLIGSILNLIARVFITSWLFWDGWTWGEWGVSAQVKRLRGEGPVSRGHRWAIWFGDNYLKPFDKTGGHN